MLTLAKSTLNTVSTIATILKSLTPFGIHRLLELFAQPSISGTPND
jgi:hypothetical protein